MADKDTTVKVAVRIRPLNDYEAVQDSSLCIDVVPGETQIRAGANTFYTFDHVFGAESNQETIFDSCVFELLNAAFEGFNATILAYGQTGSGKTYTMGSAAEEVIAEENLGIIPRVIKNLFQMIREKEEGNSHSTYKVYVQFLEIYGEDIKDLLDQTKTSKVTIRETRSGEVFVTGAKEELVSSYEQMMKALEDGTKNRTTASTKMNQTSSRSHAIFTVNLEHIIHSEVVREQISGECDNQNETEVKEVEKVAVVTQEVQKCKFHFVDLAGSERAKRTGAQGQQLKEGIDINKGLLALGNVISALGDDQKKGKVFVPYRDSKLTRMLQDSLGGNSKTLMICCVSPAAINYNESLNALRYANRARNIKNKPVVNRDPTVVLIDELRSSLMMLATELLEVKKKKVYVETNANITQQLLEDILLGNSTGGTAAKSLQQKQIDAPSTKGGSSVGNPTTLGSSKASASDMKKLKEANDKLEQQYYELKSRLNDAEFEMQRLTEQLKLARQSNSEIAEQVYFAQSERDFFKLKWSEACPQESQLLDKLSESVNSSWQQSENAYHQGDASSNRMEGAISQTQSRSPILQEKKEYTNMVTQYLREIDDLKRQLATERSGNIAQLENLQSTELTLPAEIDTEFTSAISSLIAQTRTQLIEESKKLHSAMNDSMDEDDEEELSSTTTHLQHIEDVEEEEKAFNKRQRLLNAEVAELGQSIQLKEQLMTQLIKSQQQYSVMKSFYEQKLSVLSLAMQEKQAEREKLLAELSEITEKSNQTAVVQAREAKLREDLKVKDEELSKMKKKQDELRNLTQLQSQYSRQMAKLEGEIVSMKRQRVDLTKTLQQEKKNYMVNLSEKAKEIEKLKKELYKASTEVKKLGRSKELAESKAKDALREGAALKKKTQELMKFHVDVTSTAAARAAIRAISKASAKFASSKYLTEEELRVKRWIDQRISEISAREAAAEALKRQCEQQLELLQRKEALENERRIAISKVANQEVIEMANSDVLSPSTPIEKNSKSAGANADSSMPSTPLFTSSEEEKLLELIEDRLSSIDGQLNARNQKISDIRRQISEAGDIPGSEKAVDVLKKTSAGSLPAAHELIRMLFDMLIHVSKDFKIQHDQISELLEKERSHMQRIDDLQNKLVAEKRAHDIELTTMNKDFEQKLQGFFHHIVPDNTTRNGRLIRKGSGGTVGSGVDGSDSSDHELEEGGGEDEYGFEKVRTTPSRPASAQNMLVINGLTSSASSNKLLRRTVTFDTTAIQLAITTEESKLLKSQLEREQMKTSQYEMKITELEKIKFSLMMDIEDKNSQIKFLEEDRELFKKMSEELKNGLNNMGKDGKTVVLNATDRVSGSSGSSAGVEGLQQGLFGEYLHLSDNDGGGDDDTESILGEYENLVEEIHRTGGVSNTKNNGLNDAMLSSKSVTGSGGSHDDIFHRLHNPSNYTGHMRSIFKDNLARRKVVQEGRGGSGTSGNHHTGNAATGISNLNYNSHVHDPMVGKKHVTSSAGTTSAIPQHTAHHHKKDKDHFALAAANSAHPHHYYSFSTTLAPWKKGLNGSDGLEETNEQPASLSIDVSEPDSGENASPEPVVPNVFSRLTTRMTGIHKHRDITPRTTSPSSAGTALSSLRPAETAHEIAKLARTASASAISANRSLPNTPAIALSTTFPRQSGSGSSTQPASHSSSPDL